MVISQKVAQFVKEGGWIRKMFESGISLKNRYGDKNVFDLSLGNPVIEPPKEFHEELLRLAYAQDVGMHRYMPNAGYPETRHSIASALSNEIGIPFSLDDIVMTCGAAGGLNVVLKTLLDPGDEVIIFAPYFVEYVYYIDNHRGVTVVAPTDSRFYPDLDVLASMIGPKTKAVIINSPNNPSGAVYPVSLVADIGKLLRKASTKHGRDIFLVSDEPYRNILYDGLTYPHVFSHYNASIAVTSHAKDLALPGERIGYIATNPSYEAKMELVDGFTFCNRILGFVNAPAIMQRAVRALQGVTVDIAQYQKKRDYLYSRLTSIGYSVEKPMGAFYMFPRVPSGGDDVAFVDKLLTHNVLVVPGKGFGAPGFFRISYCVHDDVLDGSIEGFSAVMHS